MDPYITRSKVFKPSVWTMGKTRAATHSARSPRHKRHTISA
jgi:hypothetical protein